MVGGVFIQHVIIKKYYFDYKQVKITTRIYLLT